jgi:IS30 family transposase
MKNIKIMRYSHFTKNNRTELSILLKKGYSYRDIGKAIKKCPSSISREVKENSVNGEYDPDKANHKAYVKRKYSKYQGMKVWENYEIWSYVEEKMQKFWSPEMIAGRLERETNGRLTIKPDTIYKYLYSGYGQHLCCYLKSCRYYKRKRRDKNLKKEFIPNRISIEERPNIINHRRRYGDYEGDTMGRPKWASSETLAVTRERKSRKLFALKVHRLKYAVEGFSAILNRLNVLSFTLDNGLENIRYEKLNVSTFFCHPYSSWEKGSVEQGIGLIRQFIPKKSDLKGYTQSDIDAIIDIINNRPLKCLNWKTPNEVFNEHNKQLVKQEIGQNINIECCA